jgi:hypothetical protein
MAYKVFMDAIEAQGRALIRNTPVSAPESQRMKTVLATLALFQDLDEADVTPPLAILDHAQILREIMAVYASSLSDAPSPDDPDDQDQIAFEHVLDVMIDPALQMCDAVAEETGRRTRGGWDREVFGLNCLTYLQVTSFLLGVCLGGILTPHPRGCWNRLNSP